MLLTYTTCGRIEPLPWDAAFRVERLEDRDSRTRAFLSQVRECGRLGFPVIAEVQPGDGTRYRVSLVAQGGQCVVACAGMLAAEIDPRYEVDPDGLADLARRPDLNPCTAALVADVANAFGGHESPLYYDWTEAAPVQVVEQYWPRKETTA